MGGGTQQPSVRSLCTILHSQTPMTCRSSGVSGFRKAGFSQHGFIPSLKALVATATLVCVLFLAGFLTGTAHAQTEGSDTDAEEPAPPKSAPVTIDGETYFVVIGARSFTAEERAVDIQRRILEAAEKFPERSPVIRIKEQEGSVDILADGIQVTEIIPGDVEFEGIDMDNLTEFIASRVEEAITKHRKGRDDAAIEKGALFAFMWTACFIALSLLLWWIRRVSRRYVEARIGVWIHGAEQNTGRIINGRTLFKVARQFIRGIYVLIFFIFCYLYAYFILSQFSPTQSIAFFLIKVVADPLVSLGLSAIAVIPDLILSLIHI